MCGNGGGEVIMSIERPYDTAVGSGEIGSGTGNSSEEQEGI